MILTTRQKHILIDYCNARKQFLPANFFAEKYDLTIRTKQYEIKEIKLVIKNLDFIDFESVSSKGSKVIVHNQEKLQSFLTEVDASLRFKNLNSREQRVNKIIAFLLNTKNIMTVEHIVFIV